MAKWKPAPKRTVSDYELTVTQFVNNEGAYLCAGADNPLALAWIAKYQARTETLSRENPLNGVYSANNAYFVSRDDAQFNAAESTLADICALTLGTDHTAALIRYGFDADMVNAALAAVRAGITADA